MEDIDKNLNFSLSKGRMERYSDMYSQSYSSGKKSKERCHICHEHFTLKRRKKVCTRCELPVCKEDSGGKVKKKQRVCNVCRREEINDRIGGEFEQKLTKKYEKLEQTGEEGKKLEENIKKLSKEVQKVDKRIRLTSEAYTSSCEHLETSIQIQKEISESLAQEIKDLGNIQINAAMREEQKELAIEQMTREFEELRTESDLIINKNAAEKKNIEDLIRSLNQLLHVKELRTLLCKKCCHIIKKETAAIISAKANRKSLREEDHKEKICKGCFIF